MTEVEHPAPLGRRAARGALTTIGSQVLRAGLQLAALVILARLLTPSDYGLVAMVLAVIGVGEVVRDLGLSQAAIQARSLSVAQRDNLFWINTLAGGVLTLVCVAAAPALGALYGRDELIGITLALAPTFLMSGLCTQYRVDLMRRMRFTALASIEIGCAVVPFGVGLVVALRGHGYWALVAQPLTAGLVSVVAFAAAAGWLPKKYDRTAPMRGLLGFGFALLAAQVITYATANIDSVLVGQRFGSAQLGFYNRGLQLVRVPLRQTAAPLATVALPVLSKLISDQRRYVRLLSQVQVSLGYPMVGAVGLVVANGRDVVAVALGERWLDVAPIIQWIAVAEGVSTLGVIAYWIFLSQGVPGRLLSYTVVTSAVRCVMIAIGALYSPVAVAAAYAFSQILMLPSTFWWARRSSGVPVREFLVNCVRVSTVVAAASSVTWLVAAQQSGGAMRGLAVSAVVQTVVMLLLAVIPAVRRDYLGIWATLRLASRQVDSGRSVG